MSLGMAKNLQKYLSSQGEKPLLLWNRTLSKLKPVVDLGGKTVDTVDQLIQSSDIIFSCVSKDDVVYSILGNAAKTNVKGKIFCEMSTVHPDTIEKLKNELNAAGAEFICAPVFGAPAMAEAGKLVCLFAGDKEVVKKVQEYIVPAFAKKTIELGEDVTKASYFKLIG